MLPPYQNSTTSSKRSNYHHNHSSRNSHGYHPYYSSSPVGVSANVHYVSSSSSSIASTAASSSSYQRLHYAAAKGNDSNSSSSSPEDDQNLSSLSTQTNPPTTPASLTSTNNTPQSAVASPVLNFKPKIEPILNVTPVTGSSTASSVSNFKLDYSASCSAQSSSVGSTSVNACSRSSSMASLTSFEVKSNFSVPPSEYSSAPSAGFMTPAAYSDIPDSPGEIFPSSMSHLQSRLVTSSVNNSASNQRTYTFMKSANVTVTANEISVLTCDSNPKSNDITLVERTVLASSTSHNNTNVVSNFGTSGYSSLPPNDDENNQNMSISEEIKQFDTCDSINESKPNVSQLTFQDEPTPDIVAIRKLLSKPTTNEASKVQQQVTTPRFLQMTQPQTSQQTMPQWGNFAFNQMTAFTPPVKLAPLEHDPNALLKTSKRLVYEEEDNRYAQDEEQYYKDEHTKDLTCQEHENDEDDKYSIASVPSDIVREHQPQNLDISNFSAILNRSKNLCQDSSKLYESSPLINSNRFIFDLIKQQSSFNNSNDLTNNNETVCLKKSEQSEEEDQEDDEHLLDEFIDEMLPIAMANTNNENESQHSQVDESINEEDEQQLIKYQKIYENNLDNHVPLSNALPKIEEEDEEETHKLNKETSNNNKKRPIVQMNKTSQLRAIKIMQSKSNQSKPTHQIKENSAKRQALPNSTSTNSISSTSKLIANQQINTKKIALASSLNRLNTMTTTSCKTLLKNDIKKT